MYGVSDDGLSICCHIHGFSPYFYVSLPVHFKTSHCGEFKSALNKAIMNDLKSNRDEISEPVLAVEIVHKLNIYGYQGDNKAPFAKITLAVPRYVK